VAWLDDSAVEGDAGSTAQGAKKNNIHFVNPKTNIEALKKVTGILAFSDEMLEDHAWMASHINNRGVYRIAVAEENQLLNGSGQNGQIQGVLSKAGVISREVEKTATVPEFGEAVLEGAMDVLEQSGFPADAIVLHPRDYAAQRLAKDSNGQYFGGGAFTGAYGNGQVQIVPSLWGLNTVISPRIPQGTALVGAFKAGGMLVRKGGVRIEATNSHADLFVSDVTVVRMEIRELLTVTQPKAFCKVSRKA
jgi:HK97 family phage major capsid protein